MCTVTWLGTESGYELFCNRDELRERGPELPPARRVAAGVGYLAPADADAGGTWVGVNEHGLGLSLLNAASAQHPPRTGHTPRTGHGRSRGLLVRDLMSAPTADEVGRRLTGGALSVHRGFTLLALEPGCPAAVWTWDGRAPARVPADRAEPPLISSGFDPDGVRRERTRLLRRLESESGGPSAAVLDAFHRSVEGGPSAYSVSMRRADASTRSLTWISVGRDRIRLVHTPGFPADTPPSAPLELERRASG